MVYDAKRDCRVGTYIYLAFVGFLLRRQFKATSGSLPGSSARYAFARPIFVAKVSRARDRSAHGLRTWHENREVLCASHLTWQVVIRSSWPSKPYSTTSVAEGVD